MAEAAPATTEVDTSPGSQLLRAKYDRVAPVYDALDWLPELRFRGWRRAQFQEVEAGDVLEVGIGTGKNLPYHRAGSQITGIDLSTGMLARAQARARRLGIAARLELANAEALPYPDASFDTVVATFVFCSVERPDLALTEACRVLRPRGKLVLLEHVLSRRPWLAGLMRWFDPVPFWVWGAHIDRETVRLVREAGFTVETDRDLALDVVKLIVARAP